MTSIAARLKVLEEDCGESFFYTPGEIDAGTRGRATVSTPDLKRILAEIATIRADVEALASEMRDNWIDGGESHFDKYKPKPEWHVVEAWADRIAGRSGE